MPEITERVTAAVAGRYRIERHIGEGGMATVYLARDLKHDRKVAVKVLRPELAAVLGAERFVQEIKTTANLQHPHILPLFDSGEADGFLYYVMPFIDGETLRDKLNRETQLGIDEAVRITTELADALDYAHRNQVIHRDIKPENILLHDGRPMVADFGIALAVSAAAGGRMTETGLSLGTPHYMSPEQATAERDVTNRSDIYSLGSMMYEMLTGSPPHVGSSAQQIIMKIVTEEAQLVTSVRKSVPPNVAAAVSKSLEKLPADRFDSAANFAAALTDPAFALPTMGATAAVPTAAPSRRSRWDRLGPVAAGVAVVALILAGWALMRPDPAKEITRVSVFHSPEQDFGGSGTFDVSHDGSLMVFEGPAEGGRSQLWVRRWDALGATPIRETENVIGPAISPDGQEVAFVRGGAIRVVPLGGGVSRTVGAGRVRCCVRWDHEGQWLYFDYGDARAAAGLGRVPAAGGEVELLAESSVWNGTQVSIYSDPLPGGNGVVFEGTKAGGGPWIMALDVASGEVTELTPGQYPRYASGHLLFATPDGGTLMAAPFDPGSPELKGPAVPIGDRLRQATGGWNYFAVSQSGKLVYGSGSGAPGVYELIWVTRDGDVSVPDSDWTFDPGTNNRGIALSPDGNQVAVTVLEEDNIDIWIKQLPRGPASRLTFDPAQDVRPRWKPDGSAVTFLSDRGGRASSVYSSLATGTGGAELLLHHQQRPFWEAQYAPDGEWLIARTGGLSTVSGGRDIWGIRPGRDSVPDALLVTDFDEKAIALSADGRWLAYESDETGRNEVYVRPFPNVNDGKWQISTGGGVMPRWGHSGRELFYVNAENEMVAALIRPGATLSVGDRRALFTLPPGVLFRQDEQYALYEMGLDDSRFMMIRAVESLNAPATRPELVLVENWDEALRQQMGGQ